MEDDVLVQRAMEKWPGLDEADLQGVGINVDRLAGILESRLGYSRERALHEAREFARTSSTEASGP
jgi:hypothetical protein